MKIVHRVSAIVEYEYVNVHNTWRPNMEKVSIKALAMIDRLPVEHINPLDPTDFHPVCGISP